MAETDLRNRLGESTSPYLQQHKDNPVHWLPWGEEALRLARELDRPILLSSGYAACHWCHVMAHESFENPEIAAIMNRHFINVKVDREERPDIDHLYMQALRMMGEQGGWPLTMFLQPDGTPFWGGTYFPPEPRYGRPGFAQVLTEIARLWREERDRLVHHADALRKALHEQEQHGTGAASTLPPADLPRQVVRALINHFDPDKGGIGGAPKFPQCPALDMILHAGEAMARQQVFNTLTHMCQGGIYDHLGGGFARYSTDELWLVPHFEKMLYDNAQLITTLGTAWLQTRDELYRLRIEETVAFMERELHIHGAGYAASLDADSEGEEGKFYVWSYEEIRRLLPGELFETFARVYDITPRGNWEGRIIPNRRHALELLDAETEARLAEARQILFEAREQHVRPARDDKVLAAWNGLAISALARAGQILQRRDWITLAETRLNEVLSRLLVDGQLRQSFNETVCTTPATADGCANIIRALLDVHQATADEQWLHLARRITAAMENHYLSESADAYHFTHESVRDIPLRQIFAEDEATPSYQGTMTENLLRLAHITGEARYGERAENILRRFARDMTDTPLAHATLLHALWLHQRGTKVVLAHPESSNDTPADSRETFALLHAFIDRLGLLPPVAHLLPGADTTSLPPHLAAAAASARRPALIACRGQTCAMPVHDVQDIADALELLRQTA